MFFLFVFRRKNTAPTLQPSCKVSGMANPYLWKLTMALVGCKMILCKLILQDGHVQRIFKFADSFK